jgi:hypothetical protein
MKNPLQTIDDGYTIQIANLTITITVTISQKWILTFNGFSFDFRDTAHAVDFINDLKHRLQQPD